MVVQRTVISFLTLVFYQDTLTQNSMGEVKCYVPLDQCLKITDVSSHTLIDIRSKSTFKVRDWHSPLNTATRNPLGQGFQECGSFSFMLVSF